MYNRQENVGEAHQSTFQWIFEPNDLDTSTRQWDSFVQWLEKGSGIYWINGKPGSGKSTLMNYVHQDNRTLSLLKVWSGAKEIFTPGFFFWNAGIQLEKSTEGLLRSLLHQILQKFPDLTTPSYENQPALGPAKDGLRKCEPIAAWTERRLQNAFQGVMRQAQGAIRTCIFIDGLDEISGEPDVAIAVIEKMLSVDVKICLSSRPDRSYTEAFSSRSMLRLQDLTEPDIKTYVSDRLQPWLRTESVIDISKVLSSIASKAQGVFLWVELVVKDLIKGLKNDDTLEQLEMRVTLTPSDIQALYSRMLGNIEAVYRPHAARLFRMFLEPLTNSLLDIALALNNGFDQVSEISVQDALRVSAETEKRIPRICAGLLEVVHLEDGDSRAESGTLEGMTPLLSWPNRHACSSGTAQMPILEIYSYVTFIHRTAFDFLRQSEQGQRFLEANSPSCPSPLSTYLRAVLSKMTLLGLPEKPADMVAPSNAEIRIITFRHGTTDSSPSDEPNNRVASVSISVLMHWLLMEECNTGVANLSLCDDMDRTLATVYQRYQIVPTISHWSAQWGLQPWRINIQGERVSWCEKSSRSSSLDSFHSARSGSRSFSYRPIDFLGHAASYGLSCYVLKALDLQQERRNKEYVDYLLCCSMPALSIAKSWWNWQWEPSKSVDLVVQLLNRGGNPNIDVDFFSNTVWGWFLSQAPYTPASARTVYAMATRIFLEKEADVHMEILSEVAIVTLSQPEFKISQPESKTSQPEFKRPEMYFHHVKSVLYVVRSWLEHAPELKVLEEMIIAKGGYDSHRFTQVALRRDGYRPHQIPERQHEKLIASLNAGNHGYEKNPDPRMTLYHWPWARQLEKTYNQISQEDGDSDSRTSSDEDVVSDMDAEEEFHDSADFPITADVQDCQSIGG